MILKLKNGNTLKVTTTISQWDNGGYLMDEMEITQEEWKKIPLGYIHYILRSVGYGMDDLEEFEDSFSK